ncbi:MAG: hypothetical protein ACREOZ_00755, partial [Gloeomargaritales cyanobacterium]
KDQKIIKKSTEFEGIPHAQSGESIDDAGSPCFPDPREDIAPINGDQPQPEVKAHSTHSGKRVEQPCRATTQANNHETLTSRSTRQPNVRATRQLTPLKRTTSRPTRQPDDRATRQPALNCSTPPPPTRQLEASNTSASQSTMQSSDILTTFAVNSRTATDRPLYKINLMFEIQRILATPLAPVLPPFFRFSMTERASAHNHRILKASNFDVHQAIMSQPNSPVTYGSEFRPWYILQPLLSNYPLWHRVKDILQKGITMPLKQLTESERKMDIEYMKSRGNHKSTLRNMQIMRKLIEDDVANGHSLPIPIATIQYLNHVSVAPLGLADQITINELGASVPKYRMTLDQSLVGLSGNSVNIRTIVEELQPCMFGQALRRMLHYIADCRRRHPKTRILMGKFDKKAAYRRAHFMEYQPMRVSQFLRTLP